MAIVHVLLCELYILSDKIYWKVTFCHSKPPHLYISHPRCYIITLKTADTPRLGR